MSTCYHPGLKRFIVTKHEVVYASNEKFALDYAFEFGGKPIGHNVVEIKEEDDDDEG